MDRSLSIYVGIVQFFFAVTWTVYVVYLPQLVEQAGIARSWVPWILVADQLVFAMVDVATGFWVDRVRSSIARLGPWILGVSVVSGLAFVALPFAGASAALLLAAILAWAVTSSALRSPPWALLSRHAATPRLPWVSTIALTGTASYLGGRLLRRLVTERGPEAVVAIDITPPPTTLHGVRHRMVDLTLPGADSRLVEVFREERVETVFHAAFFTTP